MTRTAISLRLAMSTFCTIGLLSRRHPRSPPGGYRVWCGSAVELRETRSASCCHLVDLVERALQGGLAGPQVGGNVVQAGEQHRQLSSLGGCGAVVHVDDL